MYLNKMQSKNTCTQLQVLIKSKFKLPEEGLLRPCLSDEVILLVNEVENNI